MQSKYRNHLATIVAAAIPIAIAVLVVACAGGVQ